VTIAGQGALWVALLFSAWSALTSIAGESTARTDLLASARRATMATLACLLLSLAALVSAFVSADLSLRAVAEHVTINMPRVYRLAAVFATPGGIALVWCAVMAGGAAALGRSGSPVRRMPRASAALMAAITLLLAATLPAANPFARLTFMPPEGLGMPGNYQRLSSLFYHAVRAGALASAAWPYALALASIRATRAEWRGTLRRSAIISSALLFLALVAGMMWTHDDGAQRAFWTWDPSQNALLVAALAMGALAHVARSAASDAAPPRVWMLATGAFAVAVACAFVVPAGVIPTSDAFSSPLPVAPFAAIIAVAIAVPVALSAVRPRAEPRAPSWRARGSALIVAALTLSVIATSITWGTLYAPLASWAGTAHVTPTPAMFTAVNVPLAIVALVVMAIAAQLGSRAPAGDALRRSVRTTVFDVACAGAVVVVAGVRPVVALIVVALAGAVVASSVMALLRPRMGGAKRRGRRVGAAIAHCGLALTIAALAVTTHRVEQRTMLEVGKETSVRDPHGGEWRLASQGVSHSEEANSVAELAAVRVTHGSRSRLVSTERRQYINSRGDDTFDPVMTAGVWHGMTQDVSLVLVRGSGGNADVRVIFEPHASWVWIGSLVTLAGIAVAAFSRGPHEI